MDGAHLYDRFGISSRRIDEATADGRMLLRAESRTEAGLRLGALGLLLEQCSAAPFIAHTAAVPTDLVIHARDTAKDVDMLHAEARVLRHGRTSVVTEGTITDAADRTRLVAFGVIGWSVLGPIDPALPDLPTIDGPDDPATAVTSTGPLLDAIGIKVLPNDGGCRLDRVRPEISGPGGILHAGAIQLMTEAAALVMAPGADAAGWSTASQHLRFLSAGRSGPFVARASILDASDSELDVRVEVIDEGSGGRLIAHALARVSR
jgi:acyl-coenzyme A thioesterase PaaI-like protein